MSAINICFNSYISLLLTPPSFVTVTQIAVDCPTDVDGGIIDTSVTAISLTTGTNVTTSNATERTQSF